MPVHPHRALMRQRRLERSLTQEQAAAEIGISRWTLHRIENGDPGSPGTRLMIATYYGDTVRNLFAELFGQRQPAGGERMTILLAAALLALAAATALVVRAIVRDRRQINRWNAERETAESMLVYHARRSQEIRAGIDELGDDAQHLFPAARNNR